MGHAIRRSLEPLKQVAPSVRRPLPLGIPGSLFFPPSVVRADRTLIGCISTSLLRRRRLRRRAARRRPLLQSANVRGANRRCNPRIVAADDPRILIVKHDSRAPPGAGGRGRKG